MRLFLKVFAKQFELIIGQFEINNHGMNQYKSLPYMYHNQIIIASARPKPIVTYDAIVYPFDSYVWGFTLACIMTVFIITNNAMCMVQGNRQQIPH